MAKPNYQFEKRQRDIAKKKKQDEKRSRKLSKDEVPADQPADTLTSSDATTASESAAD